jgi:hypothetical protein
MKKMKKKLSNQLSIPQSKWPHISHHDRNDHHSVIQKNKTSSSSKLKYEKSNIFEMKE